MIKKIKQIIALWLLKRLGYKQTVSSKWKPGYVRYFNILSYPKEGWINTFHNYDNEEELKRDLGKVFADDVWGSMIPKNSPQIVIKKHK